MKTIFKPAERKKLKLRLAIQGPSGSGKTYSALRIATGLVGENGKICVVDTESNSASLYCDKFKFDAGELFAPYAPEKFIQYLKAAEQGGYDCVIIDSISHEWKGSGGILDIHAKTTGVNSFANWGKVSPRHEEFLHAILNSSIHVIVTMRSKQSYALQENEKGKQTPVKIGLEPVQRDDIGYEFTVVFDIAQDNQARCIKDRTQLFSLDRVFLPTEEIGRELLEWLELGEDNEIKTVIDRIDQMNKCKNIEDLTLVFEEIKNNIHQYSESERSQIVIAKDAMKRKLLSSGNRIKNGAPPPKPKPEKPDSSSSQENLDNSQENTVSSKKPGPKVQALINARGDKEKWAKIKSAVDAGVFGMDEVDHAINYNSEKDAAGILEVLEE